MKEKTNMQLTCLFKLEACLSSHRNICDDTVSKIERIRIKKGPKFIERI